MAQTDPRHGEDLAATWKALGSPVRRRILDLLREGPRTTGELAVALPELSRFAVMQHLRVLEAGRLVVYRRRGRQRFNYLNPIPIQEIYHRWVRRYEASWAEALVALRGALEEETAEAAASDPPPEQA